MLRDLALGIGAERLCPVSGARFTYAEPFAGMVNLAIRKPFPRINGPMTGSQKFTRFFRRHQTRKNGRTIICFARQPDELPRRRNISPGSQTASPLDLGGSAGALWVAVLLGAAPRTEKPGRYRGRWRAPRHDGRRGPRHYRDGAFRQHRCLS